MYTTSNALLFLTGSFALSLIAFLFMFFIPAAQSPEGMPGLPIWILAVWSPSVTALVIALKHGEGLNLLKKLVAIEGILPALALGLIPLIILFLMVMQSNTKPNWHELPHALMIVLVLFNLLLGPLGEELGWRGFLQPVLSKTYGWLYASLIIGVIWGLWHAPLWLIDSPQSEIPYGIFFGHVMAYSLLMGAAWSLAPHSLLPAVILHLLFNVSSGVALIVGVAGTADWYKATMIPFLVVAVIISLVLHLNRSPSYASS